MFDRFILLAVLGLAICGCSQSELQTSHAEQSQVVDEAPATPPTTDGMTAVEIMRKLVATYREAKTYSDFCEYGTEFVSATDGVERQEVIMTFSVVYDRPNRFLIAREELRLDGNGLGVMVACDGKNVEASISELEPQRLIVPAPEKATLASVAPDPLLRKFLLPRPPRDIFPQLELLLFGEGETPWVLEVPQGLELLPSKELFRNEQPPIDCYRVRVTTQAGPHTCWIDKANFLLLRIEIENLEAAHDNYPGQKFIQFVWRFDFYNAAFNTQIPDELFRIVPNAKEAGAEVVVAFRDSESNGEPVGDEKSSRDSAED